MDFLYIIIHFYKKKKNEVPKREKKPTNLNPFSELKLNFWKYNYFSCTYWSNCTKRFHFQ